MFGDGNREEWGHAEEHKKSAALNLKKEARPGL
jgi:hypothetical protein